MSADYWDDFGFAFGPFPFGPGWWWRKNINYKRTESRHQLRIRINPAVQKDEIKVRLLKPGIIEIEWPRHATGEEITLE
ncbi:MAG: hypothetical protein ONB48_21600 [candidate division KSB1 bacterium]|nr:hypothetical protein [candidate division KSB1 bacterium]MDZ7276583.1 hypothetical protein [candidate division KSB1 bacterium]MDZ7288244.1 hypothetical protein [candidate division KSB1 bacterium]MDZ7300365.1 hypothetical protein [candidate division KSB1 bacterium]MDZ7309244.1 hypothetical protein [candidate division KSB1 bacterium]